MGYYVSKVKEIIDLEQNVERAQHEILRKDNPRGRAEFHIHRKVNEIFAVMKGVNQ